MPAFSGYPPGRRQCQCKVRVGARSARPRLGLLLLGTPRFRGKNFRLHRIQPIGSTSTIVIILSCSSLSAVGLIRRIGFRWRLSVSRRRSWIIDSRICIGIISLYVTDIGRVPCMQAGDRHSHAAFLRKATFVGEFDLGLQLMKLK